jgi:hypothetical protein
MCRTHHLTRNRHHRPHCALHFGREQIRIHVWFLCIWNHWHHGFVIVTSHELLLMLLLQYVFVHFSCVVFFPIVHFVEIVKNVPLDWAFPVNFQHFCCGFKIKVIAVLGLGYFLVFSVVKPIKVLVVDVLDVDPLNEEEALELKWVIFPPEGEGLFVVVGGQSCDTLEHAGLDNAEEEVDLSSVFLVFLPQWLKFSLVLGSGGPNAVLDGLVHVVIVCATDDQTDLVLGGEIFPVDVDVLEMGEGLDDGWEVLIVLGLQIRPSAVDSGDDLVDVVIPVHACWNRMVF